MHKCVVGGVEGKPVELMLYTNLSLFQNKIFIERHQLNATNEFSSKSALFIESYLVL